MVHCENKANELKRPAARERGKALAEIFEKSPDVEGRYEPLGKAELTTTPTGASASELAPRASR
jgi:hypothetical protein